MFPDVHTFGVLRKERSRKPESLHRFLVFPGFFDDLLLEFVRHRLPISFIADCVYMPWFALANRRTSEPANR
jgi:hypothetical protein